ncbi:MAG: T9SS type A sorting domain-containing protein [Bacteroidota bacterium]
MKKYSLFFLILSTSLALHSAIFTVTNTNQTGAGSFAEAVTNTNATTDKDTIEFNIPGAAPHNIVGNQTVFSYPIYIDGDTQPANGYTGAGKKVIFSRQTGGLPNAFILNGDSTTIKNIQFENWSISIIAAAIDDFHLEENAFISRLSTGAFSMIVNNCNDGFIKDNLFNKEEKDGPCVGIGVSFEISPMDCSNLEISGNEICKMNVTPAIQLRIVQNSIIQGNLLNGGPTDCNVQAKTGMVISNGSIDNQIGGSLAGEANAFLGFSDEAILIRDSSARNLIGFNEFQCVKSIAINLLDSAQNDKLPPEITFADAASVIGTADPGDVIAVYRSADNATLVCGGPTIPQSDTYYGEATADAGGNWTLLGTFEGFLTALATDVNNNTSAFADVYDTGVGFVNTASACSSGVLSAGILGLQARYQASSGTLLSWNETEESTSSFMQIQRSTDLERWVQVGRIQTSKTTDFTDLHPPAGHTYYRIQQVNEDGSTILSSIVSVFVDAREWSELQVFPNPATDLLTLIPQNHAFLMEETTIELYSLKGERVMLERISEAVGSHQLQISSLPSGMYYLCISGTDQYLRKKISIQ